MAPRFSALLALALLALSPARPAAQDKLTFDRYHSPSEVAAALQGLAAGHPGLARIQELGKSAGGKAIQILRLAAPSTVTLEIARRPAILVCANIEGNHLIGTEAALILVQRLLAGYDGKDKTVRALLESKTIYVAPLLSPDAAQAYFETPRAERSTNGAAIDDDNDILIDEDGPDDLNDDGLITQMRVKDPEGEYIPDPKEPRLLRKADPQKGEIGIYKLYSEGIDEDGDEEINEDPPGGIELNRNFPHEFENNSAAAGRWPVSQPETIALAKFIAAHPTIALALNFSSENTLIASGGGSAAAGGSAEAAPPSPPGGRRSSSSAPASPAESPRPRGSGPATALDAQDKPLFEAVAKEYKDTLKSAKSEYPEKKARGWGKGSLAAWGYFQVGVPVFSNDVWAVPVAKKADELTVEKLKAMSKDQFLKIEDGKIDELLKKSGVKSKFSVKDLKQQVQTGKSTPATIFDPFAKEIRPPAPAPATPDHPDTDLIKWSDATLKGKGFVPWTGCDHPTLGRVEVGGFVPYLKTLPPPNQIDRSARFAADFYIKLMQRLPALAIRETRVKALDDSLYVVTAFINNPGRLPTATAQGRRAQTAWPVTVKLKLAAGQTIFSGRPIEKISILGPGESRKLEWTVRGPAGSALEIAADTPRAGAARARVVLQDAATATTVK